ncbi:hypothetical protein [Streptomyces formicae]
MGRNPRARRIHLSRCRPSHHPPPDLHRQPSDPSSLFWRPAHDHVCLNRPLRVAVIGGGQNCEHEVSLATAAAICDALPHGYEALALTIGRDGTWHDAEGRPFPDGLSSAVRLLASSDVAFPLCTARAVRIEPWPSPTPTVPDPPIFAGGGPASLLLQVLGCSCPRVGTSS